MVMMKKKTGATILMLGLATFSCSSSDTASTPGAPTGGANGFQVTVSGEDLATVGYGLGGDAKANGDPPAFVDGWEVRFEHVLVTIDNVRLNENPDTDPNNPETQGAVVATAKGPWAVDATIGGNVAGKSGSADERATEIATIPTKSDGSAFDPAQRYAFNYDLVAASDTAKLVNLDAAGKALYEQAKTKGWATVYQGTATYKGSKPAAGSVFEKIPSVVRFTLGFANPTSYINCENTDLGQVGGEQFPRGLQPKADATTIAQITIHTDHSFWSKLNVEGTELHFDPIAAQASTYGTVNAPPGDVTLDDLVGVDVTSFTTKTGEPLPARSEVPDFTAPAGTLSFDPNGTSFAKPNSFASFIQYSASSSGHLNADGLCKVKDNFTP